MTRINEAEFAYTLTPLFSDLNTDDLTVFFRKCLKICEEGKEEFICSHSRENNFKRTVFLLPKRKTFYICLNKDMDFINRNLKTLSRNKMLKRVLGNFSELGFVRERGSCKVCNPMIRISLEKTPSLEVCGKLSGVVQRAGLTTHESKQRIDQEMQYRKDYNDASGAPTIEFQGYYTGIHKDSEMGTKAWREKFIEISELLDRDLHAVAHPTDTLTLNLYKLNDSQKYQILFQVARFLHTLHDDGLVHGDVKAENIYLKKVDSEKILAKLGDFGHVAELHKLHLSESSGTDRLWSPEHIRYAYTNDPNDRSLIGFPADIWGFGWIVVHLFNLNPPKWYRDQIKFLESASWWHYLEYQTALSDYANLPFPVDGTLPEQLLWLCWRPEESKRIKADQLMAFLFDQCGANTLGVSTY